jgi:hypothetical protein
MNSIEEIQNRDFSEYKNIYFLKGGNRKAWIPLKRFKMET